MVDTDHESSQADKFRDTARELEANEDAVAFEEKRRVATAPKPQPKPEDKK
ncbi:hypothetical protein [uncultured Brevundimonas sp.]|uniref:hypothetical protein n=1 Tax=uncultured Brevundimonas sp. TaxID=213418 RepID=UPI00259628F4|nr:hypothetical protein [uncultured Brevundimonas sp.]